MSSQKPKRPTMGVLVGWQVYEGVINGFLDSVFRGLYSAARDLNCNLLLACGVTRDPNVFHPAWPILTPETDFVPVGPWNTDGLIVINPLLPEARAREIQDIRAAGHPVVFINTGQTGPTVTVDNEGGIRQAIAHLAEHGHRRIAFIAGIEGDPGDSQSRLEGYHAAIHAYHLESDPNLIAYGSHSTIGGRLAVRQMLDAGIAFTAVLASNDESAFGAMQALQEAGRRIPREVAVIGFDDRLEAAAQRPSLTSVHYPITEAGYRALELLLKCLEGQTDSDVTVKVPTRLVIRRSCGCLPGNVTTYFSSAADDSYDVSLPTPTSPRLTRHVARLMSEAVLAESHYLDPEETRLRCLALAESFVTSLQAGDSIHFLTTLDEVLQRVEADDNEPHIWQAAISVLKGGTPELLQVINPLSRQPHADELLDQARLSLSEGMRRYHRRYVIRESWIADHVGLLAGRLLAATTESQILEALAELLPALGVQQVYIAVFEAERDDPVRWSLLRGPIGASEPLRRFPSREFPPPGLYPADRPWHLALLPIVIQKDVSGFVAFDAINLNLCAPIVWQLAAAFKSTRLFQEVAEGRRLAEEANRLKNYFLSTVSHELRTPLNLIVGLSEMLLREQSPPRPTLPEEYREDLKQIHVSAQVLNGLIRDVLDLSRSEAGQLTLAGKRLEFSEVLQPVMLMGKQMALDKGLGWQTDLPAEPLPVWGDATRLQQVILNLVSNAIKFTERGTITITVERMKEEGRSKKEENPPSSVLRPPSPPEWITFSISDTGLGIPLSEQGFIFDEFRQSERTTARGYGGLGLGLAICKRLIELHGGQIGVRASGAEDAGSTFYFSLPLLNRPMAPPSPATHAQPLALLREALGNLDYLTKPVGTTELAHALTRQGLLTNDEANVKTILIVDDEPGILEMHARLVEAQSPAYRVIKAQGGRDALEQMQQQHPDLVLLDLMMPDLNGFGVLQAMRRGGTTRDIPVIVLTAQALTEEDMARLNDGVATVLGKGLFTAEETLTHVEVALSRHPKPGSDAQRLVRRAMAYIHRRYAEPLSRKGLAAYVGISEDYLTRCFREEIGVTPMAYLRRYRLNKAKELLTQGQKSVAAIALAVGFPDHKYFMQVFRREVGVSPGTYRRGKKAGQ